MLFRNINGELIEINKYDFKNDKLYYQQIMEIKKEFTKSNKSNNINYSNYIINNSLKKTFDDKNK
jgi:hypothetical protein